MAKRTADEVAQIEAAIRADEQKISERWCALRGHKWDLPQPNPLNAPDPEMLVCRLQCNRCLINATLTIVIDPPPVANSTKGKT
jgi:hypothetical protein